MLKQLQKDIKKLANPKKALILQRFFKTGKGQYGEGDIFLGIAVPKQRELTKKYWQNLSLSDIAKLLKSKIHEERLIALLILTQKFRSSPKSFNLPVSLGASQDGQSSIFQFYLAQTRYINNWDLVDLSAPNIVGDHLINRNRSILYKLAKSKQLWEKRIAILATFAFIKQGDARDTIKISKLLINDKHDLIHKAVGWMLREVGKRSSEKTLTDFLDKNAKKMPRTMLRYAIERLPEKTRKHYLTL